MATTKVTMVTSTRLNGEAYLAGHTYDVDKDSAERWVDLGIAEEGASKRKEGEMTPHEQAQQNVQVGDLEVAALHGDVAAARKLDAFRRGEAPLEPAQTVAGEPAPKAQAGTGESARASLAPTRAQSG